MKRILILLTCLLFGVNAIGQQVGERSEVNPNGFSYCAVVGSDTIPVLLQVSSYGRTITDIAFYGLDGVELTGVTSSDIVSCETSPLAVTFSYENDTADYIQKVSGFTIDSTNFTTIERCFYTDTDTLSIDAFVNSTGLIYGAIDASGNAVDLLSGTIGECSEPIVCDKLLRSECYKIDTFFYSYDNGHKSKGPTDCGDTDRYGALVNGTQSDWGVELVSWVVDGVDIAALNGIDGDTFPVANTTGTLMFIEVRDALLRLQDSGWIVATDNIANCGKYWSLTSTKDYDFEPIIWNGENVGAKTSGVYTWGVKKT